MPGAKNGTTQREHLESAARRGVRSAIGVLNGGPDVPACLAYLLDWLDALHGRSGVSMTGIVPLTYSTIADWARLTDTAIAPHEVRALLVLDSVRCHPGTPEQED